MCGIIARVGTGNAVPSLLKGLSNLEYRGYDSAGIALCNGHGVEVVKREGEIDRLVDHVARRALSAGVGIGHTRWSTHGPPTDVNAHPHTDCTGSLAVVHNGIIENHDELRARLQESGHEFRSDTDTEVVPHLIEEYLSTGRSPEEAFHAAVDDLSGSYALAMVHEGERAIYAARNGSPMVLGIADGALFVASDVPAFLEFTDRVVYLEDGHAVRATPDGYTITDDGEVVHRPVRTVDWTAEAAEKGGYDHYMLKEIHEQPTAIRQILECHASGDGLADLDPELLDGVDEVQFVACGTSYHAALYGSYVFAERGIPASTHLASEYATHERPVGEGTLVVAVTQSGETADTLAAIETAQRAGARTLAVTNVVGSSASRVCDDALYIRAGPEIGVAATKTFSSQVVALSLFADHLAGEDSPGEPVAFDSLPEGIQRILDTSRSRDVAERYRGRDAFFFIGRGVGYPVALEGALKFKEISYEHAEGFAAGELKHGPLALVTPASVVFAVFTGRNDEKLLGNVREAQTRGATVVAITDGSNEEVLRQADDVLFVPESSPIVAGLLANVQLQLVSYHAAALLGRPIDKPRNLAKSVTVE
ncbi:glutamine--fructose-6-phosphate transaminase (isomerizing) [Halalkalicoccus sp. NIPERK01]|uniref:glutamine--fructose-6-phosphate transaminase (isomerizing) n=1 Tax=Halalkalicoccus sp. NIPERK01 TaxID=3053469 RepID=UPI00256EA8B4|nr:glutamine--fructose-6-phosphate transaminase (isomerizing) [Halalkalicoccus sp. NIPERK01]MDL5360627.1 glutamine--fructose-6-phosphate transaminase (isomerizing) [Halalkalicoccus sp. NIPERK01]